MEEQIRDPKEDISYIRRILEKAADDMRTAAPYFLWFGVIWLVYGLITAVVQRLVIYVVSVSAAGWISVAGSIVSWLFYIVLAVGFFVVRQKQKQNGCDTLALKLIDMWGACILLFLFLCAVTVVVPFVAVRVLAFSSEMMNSIGYTLAVCRSCLIFILPLLPLIITAVFLENRRMLWAGIALAVLAAAILGSHIILLWGGGELSVTPAWVTAYTVVACLLDIAPGVMLLLFGRSLKRG